MDEQSGEQFAARWKVLMQRGVFEAAWDISDAVRHARAGVLCSHWPRHLQYIWDGTQRAQPITAALQPVQVRPQSLPKGAV
jgi:hypothetical protein